jgi:hypothetical protein
LALSFDAVVVTAAVIAVTVVSIVAVFAATAVTVTIAAVTAATTTFISSASFCGSSSVNTMYLGETGHAVTSSSPGGPDVQFNWDDFSG